MKRIDAYTKNYHPYTIRIPHVYHIQDSSVYQKLPPVYHTHTMNRVVAYTKKYHRIPPVSIRIPPWGAYTTRIPPVYPQYTISIPCCTLSLAVSTVLCGFLPRVSKFSRFSPWIAIAVITASIYYRMRLCDHINRACSISSTPCQNETKLKIEKHVFQNLQKTALTDAL